ncbi:MAG: thermonuclease family protein [bacterium]|nr:thermonuclease family protein [bacterium]
MPNGISTAPPAIFFFFFLLAAGWPAPAAPETTRSRVVRVIDGDTIVLASGLRVRYIGVDTPEIHHPRRPVECLGRKAAERNRELVEGKIVLLRRDVRDTDRYGRLLRYVYMSDAAGRPTGFVNEIMVREGWARVRFYPPDLQEKNRLLRAEKLAKHRRSGIWNLPGGARRSKGVLGDRQNRVYYRPGSQGYEDLRCTRRWQYFSSAGTAARAGYRAPGKEH